MITNNKNNSNSNKNIYTNNNDIIKQNNNITENCRYFSVTKEMMHSW